METRYNAHSIEEYWSQKWQDEKLFQMPEVKEGERTYSIVIPPPNVTGVLHMGHALNNTMQDIIIRFKKMQGFATVWIPGTDHAGIATQNVVERKLKAEGKRKEDLGREEFLKQIFSWKQEKGGIIIKQLQRLGCGCDWSREKFTMQPELSAWVKKIFCHLYRKDLVYRALYPVNWCSRCQTALANDEVDDSKDDRFMYTLKYKLDSGEDLLVATTRPETIFADVAVAYHPNDERYTKYAGQYVTVPISGQKVPLIPDIIAKKEFGTGLVKITPAHDKNDFKAGQRNKLAQPIVVDELGKLCNTSREDFNGMEVFHARTKMETELEVTGLLESKEEYEQIIGQCYRCGTETEPHLSEQWFVRMEPLAAQALGAVDEGRTTIAPEKYEKIFRHWMGTTTDWCISRQLWWGHQIPVYNCNTCGKQVCSEEDMLVCECGGVMEQDPDVLDTWFSSWLWPFAVFNELERKRFFPTSTLITGGDILFFWVARMIMASEELMETHPFSEVYLHGVVRDEKGEKMSKSKGNVIDPLDIIKDYSADSLRLTLMMLFPKEEDAKISHKSFELGKMFGTKLWNAVRYILSNLSSERFKKDDIYKLTLGDADRWIIGELNKLIVQTTNSLENYEFSVASKSLYDFTWNVFANRYLEMAKLSINKYETKFTLLYVISTLLQMLHPITPFVTEQLWQQVGEYWSSHSDYIVNSKWPTPQEGISFSEYSKIWEIVDTIRTVQMQYQIKAQLLDTGKKQFPMEAVVYLDTEEEYAKLATSFSNVKDLLRIQKVSAGTEPLNLDLKCIKKNAVIFPLNEHYNVTKERTRIQNTIGKLIKKSNQILKKHETASDKKQLKLMEEFKKLTSQKTILEIELKEIPQ